MLLLCKATEHLAILMEAVLTELRLQRGIGEDEFSEIDKTDGWRSIAELQRQRRSIFEAPVYIAPEAGNG
jgi:hypothetical protein